MMSTLYANAKKKECSSMMKCCRRGIEKSVIAYSNAGFLKMPLKNIILFSLIMLVHMESQTQLLAADASVHQVLSVNPISNSVSASPATTMVVTFASTINPSSVSENTFLVYGNITGKHHGSIIVDNNNQRLTFTPQKAFAFGEKVQAILTAGIYFSDGTQLAHGYSWKYHIKTQLGSGRFVAVPEPLQSSGGPYAISAGDFNGDGFPDIAVANSIGNSVSVYLNNSHGSFLSPRSYPSGTSPKALCVGDLNGDGNVDLVVANSGTGTVSVFMNDGKGSFGSSVNYAVGANPVTIKGEDINNDGKLDLIVGNSGDSTMSILKNDGTGVFLYSQTIPLGAAPSDIALGDLDNDGTVDAVTCNGSASTMTILKNANGVFIIDTIYNVPYGGSETALNSIAIFDFDKDGFSDVAVANGQSYEVSIFLNDKKGRVTVGSDVYHNIMFDAGINHQRTTLSLYGNDFNADGVTDLSVANLNSKVIRIFLNKGTSIYPDTQTVSIAGGPQGIEGLDMSGRFGVMDLVTVNPTANTLTILRNQPTARPAGTLTSSLNNIVFPMTTVGDTSRILFQLYSALVSNRIDSVTTSGLQFFVTGQNLPFTVNGYDSASVQILFLPNGVNTFHDTIKIYSADGKVTIPVYGTSSLASVALAASEIPSQFSMDQNFPNPFNPSTRIRISIPVASDVSIVIFDMLGREIATPMHGEMQAGYQEFLWQAKNIPSGVYFYQIYARALHASQTPIFISTKKLVILK